MAGVGDEETMDEQDKGPLTYQESKVYHSEPHINNVYDNTKRRVVTFEVYGLDTQDMLWLQYNQQEFDNLFRFNADLMNPNRKAGRYHWVIKRLEIAQVAGKPTLRLANEPTKEEPELPIYEEQRKIPTGRMDLKARKRLRDQMDMLKIKREENIRKKREVSKGKFLKHIFQQKEIAVEKQREVNEKIEAERQARAQFKEELEEQEAEEAKKVQELAKVRRIHAEAKDRAHEEKEEEDLRNLRLRWKAADAEKARIIAEAHKKRQKELIEREQMAQAHKEHMKELQAKREVAWELRDKRVQRKQAALVNKALALLPERKRMEDLRRERTQEYIKDLHNDRQPIFGAQLERANEREEERKAEAERVAAYIEEHALPKKVNTKGKKAKKHPSSAAKKKQAEKQAQEAEGKEGAPEDKKETTERIVDAVEMKMRAEMAEQQRRGKLDSKRAENLAAKEEARKQRELIRIQQYKSTVRIAKENAEKEAEERRLIIQEREDERFRAEERRKQADEKLRDVREKNEARYMDKQLAVLASRVRA
mmetsp:Transcript_3546/g.5838  ORF Transcript_3546/g.5838 Transcript_3546/m.5838 type:complete len:537 (+) Transcript_3546:118-1728(+)